MKFNVDYKGYRIWYNDEENEDDQYIHAVIGGVETSYLNSTQAAQDIDLFEKFKSLIGKTMYCVFGIDEQIQKVTVTSVRNGPYTSDAPGVRMFDENDREICDYYQWVSEEHIPKLEMLAKLHKEANDNLRAQNIIIDSLRPFDIMRG